MSHIYEWANQIRRDREPRDKTTVIGLVLLALVLGLAFVADAMLTAVKVQIVLWWNT